MSVPTFKPGQAFSNQELWLEDFHYLKNQQIPIPKFAWNAVNTQSIDLLDPEYCWANKRGVSFNNKKFGNFDQLVAEYKCKSESRVWRKVYDEKHTQRCSLMIC